MRPVSTRASGEDASRKDRLGNSPLHCAAKEGNVQKVRELLRKGADTRLCDKLGLTPLHLALYLEEEEVADLLAEADCGNDIEPAPGITPLYNAAMRDYVGVIRKLLAGGARTRVRDGMGQTPLHHALDHGKEAAAELLVESDGCLDIQDCLGRTPLHQAADRGFVGIVATLLHNDLNPHIRDIDGMYPIHLALRRGRHHDVPKLILSSYALKDIDLDWVELELAPDDQEFCVGQLSLCCEEIRLMKETEVGASSVSYHDLVTLHVSLVAPRLQSESTRGVVLRDRWEREFPHYKHLISIRLRSAEERRVSMDWCQECFSLLSPELPPLPVTCTDIILRSLSVTHMENFIRAVQLPSWK